MAYRLDLNRDLTEAVRLVAGDQADKAIADLREIDDGDVVEAVHDCRKRCKKIRGLGRLVRPALGTQYRDANDTFRDAARALSPYRDSHALLVTFDDLVAASPGRLPTGGVGAVRRELAQRADASTATLDGESDDVGEALHLLGVGRDMIDDWSLDTSGWDAIDGGVAKTYGRGRDALKAAAKKPKVTRFPELRKRVKYTWNQLRLLESTAPSQLKPLASTWHDLSDGLGDTHDLALMRRVLADEPDAFGGIELVDQTLILLDGHREMLERRSLGLAARLYADDVDSFVDRLGGCWKAHVQWGDEGAVGEIANLFESDEKHDDLTVTDLRERARAAGVTGRSSMRRDELIAALRAETVL